MFIEISPMVGSTAAAGLMGVGPKPSGGHCKTRRVVKSTLNFTKKSCDLSLFLVIFH